MNYTRDTTSGQEGLDLLERIRGIDPTLPVLVITAWSSVAGAVEAMRRGARDYIEKPWDDERLLVTVRTQVDLRRALRRGQRLQEANTRLQRGAAPAFIGDSPAMREVRRTIERVADSDAAVLLTGEHGTGKEVAATWLHALSDRKSKPLVTMNAGGLAEGIAESELFGHVKGAFTDAQTSIGSDASSSPTRARCSSTRLPTCPCGCRRSCCACCRPAKSSAWARRASAT